MRYLILASLLLCSCKTISKSKSPDIIINDSIKQLDEIDSNVDAILENAKGVQPPEKKKAIEIHANSIKKINKSLKPALSEAVQGTKAIEKERDKLQKEKDSGFLNMLKWIVAVCLIGIGICAAIGLKVHSLADEAVYIGAGLFITAVCCFISMWILQHIWIIAIVFMLAIGAIGFKFLHKNRKKIKALVEQTPKSG